MRGGMNRSQPYAATIPANETRFQVPTTLAIFDSSGSAQGTPRDAATRATMNGQRDPAACWSTGKGAGCILWAGRLLCVPPSPCVPNRYRMVARLVISSLGRNGGLSCLPIVRESRGIFA